MEPIPKPEALNADRVLRDDREEMSAAEHRSQAQVLDAALHQSCAYAEQLWDTLDAVRAYLYTSVDDIDDGSADRAWQEWIQTAAGVTSVLCGPHGDSGYGRERAEQEVQHRRAAAPDRPDVTAISAQPTDGTSDATHTPDRVGPGPSQLRSATNRRRLLTGVLLALAVRGLRPRRVPEDVFDS